MALGFFNIWGAKTGIEKGFNPNQPRWPAGDSRGGEFRSVGAASFASPNVDDLDIGAAERRMGRKGQHKFKAAAIEINKALKLSARSYSAVGAWADGAENTLFETYAPGWSYERIKTAVAMKGYIAQQKAVIPFIRREDGPSRLYRFTTEGKSVKDVHQDLLKRGIEFHTLVPHRKGVDVVVFSEKFDDGIFTKVRSTANDYGSKVVQWKGQGEFLGSWTSREEGAAIYERQIASFAGARGSRGRDLLEWWGSFRDHWGDGRKGQAVKKAKSFAELWKGYDPRQPRWPEGHPSGGQWRSHKYPAAISEHAAFEGPRMALKRVRGERAFGRGGEPPKKRLGKLETGQIMEQIALAYLHQNGFRGATILNAKSPSFPIDIYEPKSRWAIEVKGGDAGNGKSAWHWRYTAGEPGSATRASLRRMSAAKKAAYHARVMAGGMLRKELIVKAASRQLGKKIRPMMLTGIIDADRKLVDLHVIRGFHERIGWVSRTADKAYVGTFRYSKTA
jgi:hypothetical protein